MSKYPAHIKLPSHVRSQEIELLTAGYSYHEIVAQLGVSLDGLRKRNQKIYQINQIEAFRSRLERDGIPNRLNVEDEFGYWFSGWFDGEGCLQMRNSRTTNNQKTDQIGITVKIRDDDLTTIEWVKKNLSIGNINSEFPKKGNPVCTWDVTGISDLAEVIVPLFDTYNLRTKKAKEYVFWKQAVLYKYITTMGGRAKFSNSRQSEEWDKIRDGIRSIRMYKSCVDMV